MSILDKAKQALGGAKDKAADLAHEHGGKLTGVIDKAGDLVDKTTKGKYADKIDGAQAKAKAAVTKLGDTGAGDTGAGDTGAGDPEAGAPGPTDATDAPAAGTGGPATSADDPGAGTPSAPV